MKARAVILVLIVAMFGGSWLMQSFVPDNEVRSYAADPLKQEIPYGFPPPVYTFKNNPLTQQGFNLGRRLFYEGRLSKDNYIACASCHQQHGAFSDFEHLLSHGDNNQFTLRNAPPLFNLAWHKELHLDGGINHIEVQPLAPITASNEMASGIDSIIAKLSADTSYTRMFKAAFGDATITSQRILKALAQFTGSLTSANSKYDQMRLGKVQFTDMEYKGYQIFRARCASCHTEPLLTDFSYRNIGLTVDTFLNDLGRMRITGLPEDSLKFKVPSLRNVARTNPYMHDGRYWGLAKAINHFAGFNAADLRTDSLIRNGAPLEKTDVYLVISFLHTLTDSSFLKDKRLVAPEFNGNIHQ
ncbi:cytochrome-c peroxidase [Pseudoflavitalea sp. G-6-1-2]|uniref:cytochrome-c peroxidase n=1 Tax=Pseudoflavitalea sp. G-6-1-2 TaxID=2728841 RepID=UPI00146CBA02|nr:cytochrome c peroxidase [Pseudoflavitalea sp. G-6-1-2]NML22634.1 cytochrome-c peroxidase [Pseudoflavitalea sp. G-6-1-2]